MFHTFKKAAPVLAAAALAASTAYAADDWLAEENFSGSVALTSDYVWRGVSQSDGNPALQGSFDYASPIGIYLGVWASGVDDFVSAGNVEIDWFGGFANELEMGLGYDVGINYYSYPAAHEGSGPELNFGELYASLSYSLDLGEISPSFGVGYNFSPDFYGEDGTAHYVNGNVALSLPMDLSLSAEIGYQTVEGDKSTGNNQGLDGDDGFDYMHYRIGVGYSIKGFDLDVSYHNTNEEDFFVDGGNEKLADDRVVFTVARSM